VSGLHKYWAKDYAENYNIITCRRQQFRTESDGVEEQINKGIKGWAGGERRG